MKIGVSTAQVRSLTSENKKLKNALSSTLKDILTLENLYKNRLNNANPDDADVAMFSKIYKSLEIPPPSVVGTPRESVVKIDAPAPVGAGPPPPRI